ncbi:MAG: TonB family protein, partial [Nitrospinota bacterium]|nr:TonB family protein [Nitrospinota bacterium]
RRRRPIKRPNPPPRDLVASVKVDNFVRLAPKAKKRRSKPKTATELLGLLRTDPNGVAASPRKRNPRSRKKVRLAPLLTQDVRYRGYRYAIWKKIDERLYFPEAAAAGKVRGKVIIRFEVTRDGRLATLNLLQSSGFPLFDEEALMAIRKSAPFPKFPPIIKLNRLAIKSEILYEP